MTISDWLRSRTPPAPPALVSRVELALGAHVHGDSATASDRLLDAAVSLLQPLVVREDAGRDCALDLLAADALVTYVFEAASTDVDGLDSRTREAMGRLAGLAPAGNVRPIARG